MEYAIELKGVTKRYKHFTLENLDLRIPRGFVTGLVGPNGAGKTTLIRLIMNLLRRDAGQIHVLGRDLDRDEAQIKAAVGFVYDDFNFYQERRAATLAKVFAASYADWDQARFEKLVRTFDLPLNKRIKRLSRGMRMKFSLALALSHEAELILMDEPTAGLDPVFRRELLDQLAEILLDEQRSILFSTHITSDLDRIADHVVILDEGRVLLSASKLEIEESWGLVRVGEWTPHPDLPVRGVREGRHGTEILTDDVVTLREHIGRDAVVERPTLEDILLLLTKGGSHV